MFTIPDRDLEADEVSYLDITSSSVVFADPHPLAKTEDGGHHRYAVAEITRVEVAEEHV